ncbi:MAG: hypothetical protein HRT74_04105 [Flavobacteriales bacterium]|nr:hypothetical protein [Flavobacteriales bacterium]
MKANVLITLDTRKANKQGQYPIIMRVTYRSRNTSIKVGQSISLEHWDKKKKQVKSNYKGTSSVVRLNNLLLKKKADAMDVITKLTDEGRIEHMSVKDIRDCIVGVHLMLDLLPQ